MKHQREIQKRLIDIILRRKTRRSRTDEARRGHEGNPRRHAGGGEEGPRRQPAEGSPRPWSTRSTTPGSASSSPTIRGRPCARSAARCWRSTARRTCKSPAKENLAEIDKALKAGGNRNVKTIELPGLNHLFQPCKTGSPSEYGKIETTIAPEALKTIGDWIVEKTATRPEK